MSILSLSHPPSLFRWSKEPVATSLFTFRGNIHVFIGDIDFIVLVLYILLIKKSLFANDSYRNAEQIRGSARIRSKLGHVTYCSCILL
jgi:hypothetical protein